MVDSRWKNEVERSILLMFPAGPAPLSPPDGPVDTDGHEDDGEQQSAEDAAQQHCGGKEEKEH